MHIYTHMYTHARTHARMQALDLAPSKDSLWTTPRQLTSPYDHTSLFPQQYAKCYDASGAYVQVSPPSHTHAQRRSFTFLPTLQPTNLPKPAHVIQHGMHPGMHHGMHHGVYPGIHHGMHHGMQRDATGLDALVAAFSTGPVGLGDGPGYTDAALALATCRADGTLLQVRA